MGKILDRRHDFLEAGFVLAVSHADHVMGEITVQHELFQEAVKVIRQKDTAKIIGVIHCLETLTNYVRDSVAGAERQWQDTINFIKQKGEEAPVEMLLMQNDIE
jgi:hypothetical protein